PVISQRSENRKAQREQSSEEIDILSAQAVNHSTPIKTELGYNIHKITTGMQIWPAALSSAWTAPGTPTTRATRSPTSSNCCAPYHRWTAGAPARSSTTAAVWVPAMEKRSAAASAEQDWMPTSSTASAFSVTTTTPATRSICSASPAAPTPPAVSQG